MKLYELPKKVKIIIVSLLMLPLAMLLLMRVFSYFDHKKIEKIKSIPLGADKNYVRHQLGIPNKVYFIKLNNEPKELFSYEVLIFPIFTDNEAQIVFDKNERVESINIYTQ